MEPTGSDRGERVQEPWEEHLTPGPPARAWAGGGLGEGRQGQSGEAENTKLISPKTSNNKRLSKSFCLKYFPTFHKVRPYLIEMNFCHSGYAEANKKPIGLVRLRGGRNASACVT